MQRQPSELQGNCARASATSTFETYAKWFATLADPTRVRLLHTVATSTAGAMRVGDLATALGIKQSTCSHHVYRLAEDGFVVVDKVGTASMVSVNAACCTGLPHAADVVMGTLTAAGDRACCPSDLPAGVTTRAMTEDDLPVVRDIYAEGIATRHATFETRVPDLDTLRTRWLPRHRWVAELDGPGGSTAGPRVVGWTAIQPTSTRACYSGVGETTVYVTATARGRGVGTTLLHRQVTEADADREAGGLWTLQSASRNLLMETAGNTVSETDPAIPHPECAGPRNVPTECPAHVVHWVCRAVV